MAIAVGQRAVQEFLVDDRTIELFGEASTDRNPLHFDDEFAGETPFGGRIAHGMITGGVHLGRDRQRRCPGTARSTSRRRSSSARRCGPGDTVRVEVEVLDYDEERRGTRLSTRAFVGDTLVVDGEAKVIAPA